MGSLLDLSWDTLPNDGASASAGVLTQCDKREDEELMYAWLRERQENIELGLFLERACDLLARILAGREVTPAILRRARCLMRAIEDGRNRDQNRSNGSFEDGTTGAS